MAHTTVYKYKKDILEDMEIRFFHNGDFSGDVRIQIQDLTTEICESIEIPFEALKYIVAEYVRSKKTQEIENCKTDKLLGC